MLRKMIWFVLIVFFVPSFVLAANYTIQKEGPKKTKSDGSTTQDVSVICKYQERKRPKRIRCTTSATGETVCSLLFGGYHPAPTLDGTASEICFSVRLSEKEMNDVLENVSEKTVPQKVVDKGLKYNNSLFFIPAEKPIIDVSLEKKKHEDSAVIQPMLGFEWGDSIQVAQSKICSIKSVTKVFYGFYNQEYDIKSFCSKHINVFAPDGFDYQRENDSDLFSHLFLQVNFDAAEKIRGSESNFVLMENNTIDFEPVSIKGVDYRVSLSFDSYNKDVTYYRYFKRNDHGPTTIAVKFSDGERHYIYPAALVSVEAEAIDPESGMAITPEIMKILEDKYKAKYRVTSSDNSFQIGSNGTVLSYTSFANSVFEYKGSLYLKMKYKGFYKLYLRSLIQEDKEDSSSSL